MYYSGLSHMVCGGSRLLEKTTKIMATRSVTFTVASNPTKL
jgi:hypothetical protein